MGVLPDSSAPLLLFDGVCNLCNGFVQFIIRHDKRQLFRFSSLQSGTGRGVVQYIQRNGTVPDSLILLYKGDIYYKSDAALKIASLLGGRWSLLAAGYIFPRFIRNTIYDWVSRNRYKWFGQRSECMIPAPGLKDRFLD